MEVNEYDLHLLTRRLTDQEFQNTLKQRFLTASYTISHQGERSLIPFRVREYLALLPTADRAFAETVLSRTVYIPDNVLTSELIRIVNEFLLFIGDRPYYVFLNRHKFASTELMIIKVIHLLNHSNLIGFVTDESVVPDGSHIAVIDDASYSGTNLEGIIDSLSYLNHNVTIHVLIPYISKFMYDKLPELYNVQLYSSSTLLTIDEYRLSQGEPAFPDFLYERFQAIEYLDIHAQLPLYFDHVVASPDSSFPTIYLQGIIPERAQYGKLIAHCPDQEVRHRVYYSYFSGLLPPPMPLNQNCE